MTYLRSALCEKNGVNERDTRTQRHTHARNVKRDLSEHCAGASDYTRYWVLRYRSNMTDCLQSFEIEFLFIFTLLLSINNNGSINK